MLKTTSAQSISIPSGVGYVVESEALPIADLKALGARWVVVVFGIDRTIEEIESVIKHYQPWPVVLLCSSLAQAEIASSRKWPVLISVFNEPDLPQGLNMSPSQVMNAYLKLYRLGITPIGPNICDLNYSATWWEEFLSIAPSWLTLTVHGYGLTVQGLKSRMLGLGRRVICTEAGGIKEPVGDDFVTNAVQVIQTGITAAIYQAPAALFSWDSVHGWALNSYGQKLRAVLQSAVN